MAVAILMKTRNPRLQSVIKSALPISILGVGEPLIYGVSLPLLYPFLTACLGGGFGGAFVAWGMQHSGAFGSQALGLSGLLMAPVISSSGWSWYLGGWLISVIMGAVLTFLFGFRESIADRIID